MNKTALTTVILLTAGLLLGGCASSEKREYVNGKPKVDRSRLIATEDAKAVARGEKKDKIICSKHKKIGSNRLYTKCQTVAEIEEARQKTFLHTQRKMFETEQAGEGKGL